MGTGADVPENVKLVSALKNGSGGRLKKNRGNHWRCPPEGHPTQDEQLAPLLPCGDETPTHEAQHPQDDSLGGKETPLDGKEVARYRSLLREATQIETQSKALERQIRRLAAEAEEETSAGKVERALAAVEAKASSLNELRSRIAEVEAELVACLQQTPSLVRVLLPSMAKTISFAEERDELSYPEDPLNALDSPKHGHWMPNDGWEPSSTSTSRGHASGLLGGRTVRLETGAEHLGTIDCIIVEPMAKFLDPKGFRSSGLVLCFQGMPLCEEVLYEWGQVLEHTRCLDAGLSFALPDITAADSGLRVEDFEAVTRAAMEAAQSPRVILFGKAWGGPWACQLAVMESPIAAKVFGIILFAPCVPAPEEACQVLKVPVLIVWAEDDEEIPWEYADDWRIALHRMQHAVCWAVPEEGGHDAGRVLAKDSKAAKTVLHFAATLNLLAVLVAARRQSRDDSGLESLDSGTPRSVALPKELVRLCEELPDFLAGQLGEDALVGLPLALERACERTGLRRATRKLYELLAAWLRSGLRARFMAAAKE